MKTGLSNLFMDPHASIQNSLTGSHANHYALVTDPDEDDEELEDEEEDEDIDESELDDEDDE